MNSQSRRDLPLRGFRARRSVLPLLAVFLLALTGCSGGSSSNTPGGTVGGRARLTKLQFGRLVDLYAYRLIDTSSAAVLRDRRNTDNRQPVLIARNVVVSPNVETQPLFDAIGEERPEADYRFLPFDVSVGHEELLVLWDDRFETQRFEAAASAARTGLVEVPSAFRDQNTNVRPIPVVPRNAALKLTFDRPLGLDNGFFAANPDAVQLLEFRADPKTTAPGQAFRQVPQRVIVNGAELIVDTTIIGRESTGGQTSTGLPASPDSVTANLRLALPVGGVVGRQLSVDRDPVTELNGVDSRGNASVIRDFRSGNASDGPVGALVDVEPPMVVADKEMGIIAIDPVNRVVTVNKRFAQVAIRGRIPFVDGGVSAASSLPAGPSQVPTQQALRSGDLLYQEVESSSGQKVRIRAEIVRNLDVGNVLGDPTFPTLGGTAAGGDGGDSKLVRLQLSTVTATDALGEVVTMQASTLPLGQNCVVRVHYYNGVRANANLRGSRGLDVRDSTRVAEFLAFDPDPGYLDAGRNVIPRGTSIDPMVVVALRFSEPMDLDSIEAVNNYLISDSSIEGSKALQLLALNKPTTLSVVATRKVDQQRDGTLVQLRGPLGLFHEKGKTETYWFHVLLGDRGPTDLAGNAVDLFDRDVAVKTFSARFTLAASAEDNLVGWHLYRFEGVDEDGTPPGSIDFFGQFQIQDGRLTAARTTRFSKTADLVNLASILRYDKGECFFEGDTSVMPPIPPGTIPPGAAQPPGVLYWTPSMVSTSPNPPLVFQPPAGPRVFGGIVEPHNPRGSRLQMTYREDDFDLGYREAGSMLIDVEQLSFASWNNQNVGFDVFDRYTLRAAHSSRRPDLLFSLIPALTEGAPPTCELDCASLNSGLSTRFTENVLENTQPVTLLEDAVYKVNPNSAFKTDTNTTFVPYPAFARSFTWRDSRAVSWNMAENRAVGLGGARQPDGTFPARDRTANASSPWVVDGIPENYDQTQYVIDEGDFRGDRTLDHDPIALPLLLDFSVFPDDPKDGVASGVNLFHMALVGFSTRGPVPPPNLNGYYNSGGAIGQNLRAVCAGNDWPSFRVHTSGGVDGLAQQVFVDPATTQVAVGGWIKDVGLGDPIEGRYQTKPGDGMLYWAHADFVRKVSMVTFGFFDSRKPNQHGLTETNFPGSGWPGVTKPGGFPDFEALGTARGETYSIAAVSPIMDPPVTEQPAGTKVLLEFRGVESMERADVYDQAKDDAIESRGNLLNPNYACDAFRYAMPNSGESKDTPRNRVTGMTPYVDEDGLDTIRSPLTGLLPRYMNVRLILENNTQVTPALSPSLRSLAVVFRMAPN